MGNIITTLLCIYCRSGCQASTVASALAFHPPNPSYDIVYDEFSQSYKLLFLNPDAKFDNITGDIVKTDSNTSIPIICMRYPNAKHTMIFSHGNATDCGAMIMVFAMICSKLKINVVGYDYTGYGPSMFVDNIRPTEKQTYKDIIRAYEWVIEHKLVSDPLKQILLYGQSVGSGPSIYLASKSNKYPIAGLILHSPIMSGLRVLTPSRLLCCCDIFPNIDRINKIKVPVFVIHGEDDVEVSMDHGRGLYNKLPDIYQTEPWWVPRRGHNNVLQGNEREYFRRLNKFIAEVIQRQNDDINNYSNATSYELADNNL
jgi:pimeloyl-ACP methyl ester carboxylesterase